MITDEQIEKIMDAAGITKDEYFIRNKAGKLVAKAAELGVIDSGLGLTVAVDGEQFLVTLDVNGVRLASDAVDARMLEWAGFLGVAAVRGILTVVEREGKALLDRLSARFQAIPF